ncbi:hypothetical protein [Tepidibacter mesophilus]|uniref:hypothetical protein n=1 Tax=Tepidibacter mesophilus TaxID=655607 RepID=UPI000C0856FC|nr:hypothetical protein [Tepidibacter mesophilus]
MDYELFLFSTYNAEYMANMLIDIAKDIVEKDIEMKVYEEDEIYIGCSYFSMSVEIEDIADLEFIKKNYDLDINLCIDIQIFCNTFDLGMPKVLRIIGKLLNLINGDVLLLENGSNQVLKRKSNILEVNSSFDNYNFNELEIPYTQVKL